MIHDFMMRMFTPILWGEKRDERSEEEPRPLCFARLRELFSCTGCQTCCGGAA